MESRISDRVAAFILRRNQNSLYELLMFRPLDGECQSIQLPGGGVDPGESLEEALHREIHEETGLTGLPIIRKLGVFERCWLDTGNNSRRHCFLLEASTATPDEWTHVVHGNGSDAGLRFFYFWQRPELNFRLSHEWRYFLSPSYIPELYNPFLESEGR
jgi:8-oxo-dGTP pyrophosphatase MutT (NUDIX family)